MLELIIAVLPGILGFLIYYRSHQEMQLKKALPYILFYTVVVNLAIFLGLKLIGMQSFSLFEMSARFKIKWIALEAALSIVIAWTIRNIRGTDRQELKRLCQRVFPAALLFVITYAVFTPSSLFLTNIKEFSLRYISIVPVILCVALALFLAIYFPVLCLIRGKAVSFYIALIFGLSINVYVQGNFLNLKLPVLDGTEVDWSAFRIESIISTLFWILCSVIVLACVWFKKDKFEKIAKYICYFLSAVQMVSLVVLIITNPLNSKVTYGFSKEGEFTVGSQENIVMFIVDTLQADVMKEYLSSDAYERDGSLDDFTFYDNAVSGGAPTALAMPILLTGVEYDPTQPYEVYKKEAWEETTLYRDLHEKGYDVRLYSTPLCVSGFPEGTFENYGVVGDSWIEDYAGFGKSMYQVVNYLLAPQALKQSLWLSADMLMYHIKNTDYTINDIYFHNDFVAADETLKPEYEKAFRLYHFNGVHTPYTMTEYFDRVWGRTLDEQIVLQGDMKLIYAYIDEMKRLGVYDASTIIILGDHGKHNVGNPEINPAVLIKLPMETHKLTVNSAPIHFRNIAAAIAGTVLDDYSAYGPAVYDITEDSDVERLHTINKVVRERIDLQDYDESLEYSRIIVSGDAGTGEYQLWNPKEINRIDYTIGDIIDFTADNKYADQINYRLYRGNDAAAASNELSICFRLKEYENDNLGLHFICSDIYNNSQKIRIYANGNKIENVTCTRENIGQEMSTEIPAEYIQDGELVIRMVFPNAVTPNQLDRSEPDMRILSVVFDSMWLE